MKKIMIAMLITASIPLNMLAGSFTDTIIRGVKIQFHYNPSIFPDSWLGPGINAKGKAIQTQETRKAKLVMIRSLAKYPVDLLSRELSVVYFLQSMSMYDLVFGGTNTNDAIYLTREGVGKLNTDAYIEQVFHHEFSSILFRNYPALLDTVAWKAVNIPNFDYNDPEDGIGAIRKNESSQDLDTALCRIGFLTQYAYSSLENDLNTIAQNLFKPSAGFWKIAKDYPRIKEKLRLLIEFYGKLSPVFTQRFFMKLN